jgi:hypothetical protein
MRGPERSHQQIPFSAIQGRPSVQRSERNHTRLYKPCPRRRFHRAPAPQLILGRGEPARILPKHRVGIEMRVAIGKQHGGQFLIAICIDQDVEMHRAHGAASRGSPDPVIHRHRVARRAGCCGTRHSLDHRRGTTFASRHPQPRPPARHSPHYRRTARYPGSARNGSTLAIKDPYADKQRITGDAAENIRAGLKNRPQNRVL